MPVCQPARATTHDPGKRSRQHRHINFPRRPYRSRVNTNIQALATQNYGAAEPSPLYPNMLWFSSGDGYIKLRNPTNTAWANVGTIGPPMKWTNVDIPSTGWRAGDIKATIRGAEAGWFVMNDGTIGDQYSGATTRANPDCWEAFAYLWGLAGCRSTSPAPGRLSAVPATGSLTGTRTDTCKRHGCSAGRWRRKGSARAW